MTTPTETPRTEQLKIQLRLEQADAHSILLAYERLEKKLTSLKAQLEEAGKVGTEMLERLKLIYGDEIECGSTMERWEKTLAAMQQKEGK